MAPDGQQCYLYLCICSIPHASSSGKYSCLGNRLLSNSYGNVKSHPAPQLGIWSQSTHSAPFSIFSWEEQVGPANLSPYSPEVSFQDLLFLLLPESVRELNIRPFHLKLAESVFCCMQSKHSKIMSVLSLAFTRAVHQFRKTTNCAHIPDIRKTSMWAILGLITLIPPAGYWGRQRGRGRVKGTDVTDILGPWRD